MTVSLINSELINLLKELRRIDYTYIYVQLFSSENRFSNVQVLSKSDLLLGEIFSRSIIIDVFFSCIPT